MVTDLELSLASIVPGLEEITTNDEKKAEVEETLEVSEILVYEEFVTKKTSYAGKLLGWIDFQDRTLSVKFSGIDNWYCNTLFCFFAWIFNRKQCLLQIPLMCLITYTYPKEVLKHM